MPLVVVATAYRDAWSYDFVADARFLILENRYLHSLDFLWPNLSHDYFWSSSGASIPYWRPFTKLSWLFEWQTFGAWAGGYHLVSVTWHLLGALGLIFLARAIGFTRLVAGCAGLLYGLHATAAEPTCLTMARSDIVSAGATIWALLTFLRGNTIAHVLAVTVALASKESAVIVAPLLTLWAWNEGRLRDSWLRLLPSYLLTLSYLAARAWVLCDHDSAALTFDFLRVFVGAGQYLGALLPFRIDTGLRNIARLEAQSGWMLVHSALSLLILGLLVMWSWRREPTSRPLLAWILLSLLPVLLVERIAVPNLDGKFPLADRWLLPAAAGASLLYPLLFRHVGLLGQRVAWAACVLWAAAAWIVAPHTHGTFATEAALMSREHEQYLATSPRFRTPGDECRHQSRLMIAAMQRNDADSAVALHAGLPDSCRSDTGLRFNLFSALVHAGRMKEALSHVEFLLASSMPPRFRPSLLFLSGVTYLRVGELGKAETLIEEAAKLGFSDCDLHRARGALAELRGEHSDAAVHQRALDECRLRP